MSKNKDILVKKTKNYYSTPEVAKLLGVSRVAIFKKIRNGQIHAEKIGRNYIIPREEYETIVGLFVPEYRKRDIENTVDRVVKKYGSVLRKLGKE
ncbi:MAG: helix-turn-helix domain-containing protein [Burkholderiales bacterium]|nr:helix-turn-helix domain-containing protein [Burkholderiales bacterium]